MSDAPQETSKPTPRWAGRALFALTAMAVCALVLWQSAYWVRQIAVADSRERNERALNLIVENLRGELARFQAQPALIASNTLVKAALGPDATPQDIETLNREIELETFRAGAAEIYVLNRAGIVVAASNWATPQSEIGQRLAGEPYFEATLQGRLGRYFRLEDADAVIEFGYYFAGPVWIGTDVAGAVVVKLRLGPLAERWLAPYRDTLVVDGDGVIFMSTNEEWRFRTLSPLSTAARGRLSRDRKYPGQALDALPMQWSSDQRDVTIGPLTDPARGGRSGSKAPYLVQSYDMNEAGWRVMVLGNLEDVHRRENNALAVAVIALVSLLMLGLFAQQRRLRLRERIALQEEAQAQLETEVRDRTRDLTDANAQLRRAQDELVQATKLAALGQMSAGLSHELNQPLAAIRGYSDNARAYLERGQGEPAGENLESISELTERMARIIKNLRTYSREEPVDLRPISARRAMLEALDLLEGRIGKDGVTIDLMLPDDPVTVEAGAVRLQQVFVNILTNALDALHSSPSAKRIEIGASQADDRWLIRIRDTGPGVPDSDVGDIFDPFFTTKEVGEGMGLGLSITYGIVNQFGGRIDVRNHQAGGAEFTVTLRAAETLRDAAE